MVGAGWVVLDGSPAGCAADTSRPSRACRAPIERAPPSQNALVTQGKNGGNAVAPKSKVPHSITTATHALVIALLVALGVLLIAVLVVLLSRKRIRAGKPQARPDPRLRVIGAWHETIDVLTEAGLPELSALTSAEIATLTGEQFGAETGERDRRARRRGERCRVPPVRCRRGGRGRHRVAAAHRRPQAGVPAARRAGQVHGRIALSPARPSARSGEPDVLGQRGTRGPQRGRTATPKGLSGSPTALTQLRDGGCDDHRMGTFRTRVVSVLVPGVAAALVLSACSGSSTGGTPQGTSDTSGPGSSTSSPAPSTSGSSTTAAPVGSAEFLTAADLTKAGVAAGLAAVKQSKTSSPAAERKLFDCLALTTVLRRVPGISFGAKGVRVFADASNAHVIAQVVLHFASSAQATALRRRGRATIGGLPASEAAACRYGARGVERNHRASHDHVRSIGRLHRDRDPAIAQSLEL